MNVPHKIGALAALAAAVLVLAACGGDGATSSAAPGSPAGPTSAVTDGAPLDTGPSATPPLDMVIFVTTPTTPTTTTALPPTTTTSTTTTTTLPPTTTTSTTTSTSTSTTTTTEPPVALVRCSFAADALFAPGEAVLTTDAVDALGELAAELTADPDAELRAVTVEGHTDHRGSDEDNLTLSEARASAAAAVLIDAGIDPAIVTVVGHGEELATQPAGDTTPSDEQMADDRRVDVLIDADVTLTTGC